ALTDNDKWVYWAPYWYKDGKHIIYTAADHSDPTARPNYDLYWMRIDDAPQNPKGGRQMGYGAKTLAAPAAFSAFSAHSGAIPYPFRTAAADTPKAKSKPVRLTFNPGQDVLPVFSPDYKKVMWTSSRDGSSSTQLYIADFVPPKDEG